MLLLLTPITFIEITCFIFAIVFLLKDKTTFWYVSIGYILLVCATELTASIIARFSGEHNVWLYNIFILFEAAFISYGLHYFLKDYIKITGWILSSFSLILLVNALSIYKYGISVYSDITVSLMSIIFVIYSLLYFYLLLKDKRYVDLKHHPAFWWVGGVLIFYFGSTISNLFDDIFQIRITAKHSLRYFVFIVLNIFLYSFWIYSFICRARQRKLSI